MPATPVLSRKAIAPEIAAILASAKVDGDLVTLTCGTLDRKTYQGVNEALERLGGKWNRKRAGHVFDGDPGEALGVVLEAGKLPERNPLAYFATPPPVCRLMLDAARLPHRFSGSILEPSAGEGAIVEAVLARHPEADVTCIEVDPGRAATLNAKGFKVVPMDFLESDAIVGSARFDRVLMNPPFTVPGHQDVYVAHVVKAYGFTAPGGTLVAICPSSIAHKDNKTTAPLRSLIDEHGMVMPLLPDAFAESGTGVNAVIVVIDKPSE